MIANSELVSSTTTAGGKISATPKRLQLTPDMVSIVMAVELTNTSNEEVSIGYESWSGSALDDFGTKYLVIEISGIALCQPGRTCNKTKLGANERITAHLRLVPATSVDKDGNFKISSSDSQRIKFPSLLSVTHKVVMYTESDSNIEGVLSFNDVLISK